jgi:hypothetical protein
LAPAPFINCDELRVGEADHLFNGIEFGPGHIEYFAYASLTSAYIAYSRPMGSANFATDPNPRHGEPRSHCLLKQSRREKEQKPVVSRQKQRKPSGSFAHAQRRRPASSESRSLPTTSRHSGGRVS